MDFLDKKYRFTKGDSLEEFFKAIGAQTSMTPPTDLAKDFAAPVTELRRSGSAYTLSVGTPHGSMERTFTPGQEIDEDLFGITFKTTFTLESNKLVQVQKAPNGKVVNIVRDFTPATLTATNTVSGWDGKCVRYYEAV